MLNGKPVSHSSLDNSCQVGKIISAQQLTGTYVPLQKSKILQRQYKLMLDLPRVYTSCIEE